MDSKKFMTALNNLAEEKGIDKDIIFDAMELALTSAYKKNYHSLSNVRVDINRETGDIKIFSYKTVVFNKEFEKEDGKVETEIITDEDGNEEVVEKEFNFMASSYYKPCKELDRCLELDKYWEKDMKKWFEGYLIIAEETSYALAE